MTSPNSYNSNIKDRRSWITMTNIIMKKFEISWELPKRDTETGSEQVLLEKWSWRTCSTLGYYKPLIWKKKKKKNPQYLQSTIKWSAIKREYASAHFEVTLSLSVLAEVEVEVGGQGVGGILAKSWPAKSKRPAHLLLQSLTEARTSLVELLQFLFFFSRMYIPFETHFLKILIFVSDSLMTDD